MTLTTQNDDGIISNSVSGKGIILSSNGVAVKLDKANDALYPTQGSVSLGTSTNRFESAYLNNTFAQNLELNGTDVESSITTLQNKTEKISVILDETNIDGIMRAGDIRDSESGESGITLVTSGVYFNTNGVISANGVEIPNNITTLNSKTQNIVGTTTANQTEIAGDLVVSDIRYTGTSSVQLNDDFDGIDPGRTLGSTTLTPVIAGGEIRLTEDISISNGIVTYDLAATPAIGTGSFTGEFTFNFRNPVSTPTAGIISLVLSTDVAVTSSASYGYQFSFRQYSNYFRLFINGGAQGTQINGIALLPDTDYTFRLEYDNHTEARCFLDNVLMTTIPWTHGANVYEHIGVFGQCLGGGEMELYVSNFSVSTLPSPSQQIALNNGKITLTSGGIEALAIQNNEVTLDGNLAVTGNITKSYAFPNFSGNTLPTQTTTQNTYVPIVGSLNTALYLNSADFTITGTNNIPLVTYTGSPSKVFQVSATISGQMTTNTASTMEFRLFKNGVEFPQSCVKVLMDGNDLDPTSLTLNCLVELGTNDSIDLRTNNTTGTDSITIVCYTCVITQV